MRILLIIILKENLNFKKVSKIYNWEYVWGLIAEGYVECKCNQPFCYKFLQGFQLGSPEASRSPRKPTATDYGLHGQNTLSVCLYI